jgi:UDP-N-acetylglucosamine 2-epimerase
VRLLVVVGARPNFVKVGSLIPELERAGFEVDVAYTGSRSGGRAEDSRREMTFYGVGVPTPRWFLDIGAGTDAVQTGRAMLALEELFAGEHPDAVMVVGDLNPTLAGAISAVKARVPVIHLEAGLRNGDLASQEEINRVLVSRIASMHLAPTEEALTTLEDEGIEPERIHFVGNMMAESVLKHLDDVDTTRPLADYGLEKRGYILGSFHRPENLEDPVRLAGILDGLARAPLPVLVPDANGLRSAVREADLQIPGNVTVIDAVPYRTMLALQCDAAAIITDSSGVQQEACMVRTPCVTVRGTTEQQATLDVGANMLSAADGGAVVEALSEALAHKRTWATPKRWDKAVSDRVVRSLKRGVTPLR